MAEGLAKLLLPECQIESAGSSPKALHPKAVAAMAELGVDIRGQVAKEVTSELVKKADFVITLCQDEVCPRLPAGVQSLHWPFPDPAGVSGDDQDVLAAFIAVRDQIKEKLLVFGQEHLGLGKRRDFDQRAHEISKG